MNTMNSELSVLTFINKLLNFSVGYSYTSAIGLFNHLLVILIIVVNKITENSQAAEYSKEEN